MVKEVYVSIGEAKCCKDDFTGFERVILTTTGNLQRTVSAYYDMPVTVEILKNDKINGVFERKVLLKLGNDVFGVAYSSVCITNEKYLAFFENGASLGELFQHFCIFPKFKLLKVGRNRESLSRKVDTELNGLWRLYELSVDGISCEILEVFDKLKEL